MTDPELTKDLYLRTLMVMYVKDKKCAACGTTKELEIDHITPRVMRGTDHPNNLQTLCRSCNRKKRHLKIDFKKGEKFPDALICGKCKWTWTPLVKDPYYCPKCKAFRGSRVDMLKSLKRRNMAMTKNTRKCMRCGYVWLPFSKSPKCCPLCVSPYWNTPYTRTPKKKHDRR